MSTTALVLLSFPTLVLWLGPAVLIAACLSFGPCVRAADRLRRAIHRAPHGSRA